MPSRPPLVSCTACDSHWYSRTLEEGLRLLGECPKCRGAIEFARDEESALADAARVAQTSAPHLVLGLPRL